MDCFFYYCDPIYETSAYVVNAKRGSSKTLYDLGDVLFYVSVKSMEGTSPNTPNRNSKPPTPVAIAGGSVY